MKYILRAYYIAAGGRRILADFVVTDPHVCRYGIWATSRTAWGGETRNFYSSVDVVWLKPDDELHDKKQLFVGGEIHEISKPFHV